MYLINNSFKYNRPEKKQNQNPEVKSIKSNDDTIYNPYNFMHDAIIDLARKQSKENIFYILLYLFNPLFFNYF